MKHRISQTGGKEAQNLSRIPLQSDLFRSKISKKIESQTDQKIVKGRKGRGRGGEELREASENRRRGPLFICSFVKSTKISPARHEHRTKEQWTMVEPNVVGRPAKMSLCLLLHSTQPWATSRHGARLYSRLQGVRVAAQPIFS